jgi:hypothetical protein
MNNQQSLDTYIPPLKNVKNPIVHTEMRKCDIMEMCQEKYNLRTFGSL